MASKYRISDGAKSLALLLALALAMAGWTAEQVMAGCFSDAIKANKPARTQIKALMKALPEPAGKQVESGECVLRAMRLGVGFGNFKKTFASHRDTENAIACLEIEIFYREQQCKCEKLGMEMEIDPVLEKNMHEKYKLFRAAQKLLTKNLRSSPTVKKMISKAQEVHGCYSTLTLTLIEQTTRKLEELAANPN